jgi:aspartyl-tRNA(Asn)/glutamyl-tRNA(Gln) amidotransferase subunit A
MTSTAVALTSAVELSQSFARRELSPVEAVEAAFDAVDAFEQDVNAFVLVDRVGALAAARESERRWQEGTQLSRWDGVPTPVKDILLTKGWPTLRGSALIDESGDWAEDTPSVARVREAGCVLIGKTTTPEFAWKGVTDSIRHGATGNPWGAGLTSGGSSGGSATAVGLGMGTWSIGTDGGGSVRIPASFTGTVALKPTYGLIPHYPASPFGTLAHAGPMTRTVTDAAAMLDVLTGFDARDWSAMPTPTASFLDGLDDGVAGLRVGFSADLGYVQNDPEVERLVRDAVAVLADAGAHVDEVDPGFTDPVEAFHVLWFTGAAKVLEHYGPQALDRIDPKLRWCVEQGQQMSASQYLDADAVRMALGQQMGRFHESYDVLVTPTMPIAAFEAGRPAPEGWPSDLWTSWTPYTYPFNMTQQPALSVPCGFTSDERPVGLQVVGRRHADQLVLRVGRAYEQRTDWSSHVPTLIRAAERA